MEFRPEVSGQAPAGKADKTMVTKAGQGPDKSEQSKEVAQQGINWGQVDSLQEARKALEDAGVAVVASGVVFGDGADFTRDKESLVGIPFFVLEWRFLKDEVGRDYVNILIMKQDGSKVRFNDGGAGIYKQLRQVTDEMGMVAITCKFGLRKSTYDTKDAQGHDIKATTYYLSA